MPIGEPNVYYTTLLAAQYGKLVIRAGDIVLDAGANVGDFTVMAARLVGPRGKVIAVEPNVTALRFLALNVRLNHLTNVVIINRFISDQDANLTVSDFGTYTVANDHSNRYSRQIVSADVDSILQMVSVDRVDVAKIDIEGGEYAAVHRQRYLNTVRELAIEVHSQELEQHVLNDLRSVGFDIANVGRLDLYTNVIRGAMTHPLDVGRSEVVTRAFGTRAMLRMLRGSDPLLMVRPDCQIRLYHARRKFPPEGLTPRG